MLRSTIGINFEEAHVMLLLMGRPAIEVHLMLPDKDILKIRARMITKLERAVATMNRHREK